MMLFEHAKRSWKQPKVPDSSGGWNNIRVVYWASQSALTEYLRGLARLIIMRLFQQRRPAPASPHSVDDPTAAEKRAEQTARDDEEIANHEKTTLLRSICPNWLGCLDSRACAHEGVGGVAECDPRSRKKVGHVLFGFRLLYYVLYQYNMIHLRCGPGQRGAVREKAARMPPFDFFW